MKLFKIFRALLLAILIISSIEILLYALLGKEKIKSSVAENTLFDNQFKKFEVPQKYLIKYKQELFSEDQSQFIQVGDSSGLYGVRPNIINNYLEGINYINISCCADIGWKGYAITSNYFLRKNSNTKFLVLYVSPYAIPNPHNIDSELTNDIKGIYEDNLDIDIFRIFNYLPSQALRKSLLDIVFLNNQNDKDPGDEYIRVLQDMTIINYYKKHTGFEPAQLMESLNFHKGWMPLDRKQQLITDSCGVGISDRYFGKYKKKSLSKGLTMINSVAKNHKVDLIVIFNPVACKNSEKINPIIEELNKFKIQNPNIIFLNNFISTMNEENFADNAHLNPLGSIENSKNIAIKLKSLIKTKIKK